MKDWLENDLSVGDLVLYSSTSTLTGMNLAEIVSIEARRVQVRLLRQSAGSWSRGRKITLHDTTSAYDSITKYFGEIEVSDGTV